MRTSSQHRLQQLDLGQATGSIRVLLISGSFVSSLGLCHSTRHPVLLVLLLLLSLLLLLLLLLSLLSLYLGDIDRLVLTVLTMKEMIWNKVILLVLLSL